MRFAIRETSPADARAIAEVHVEGWSWGYRGLLPDELIAGLSVEEREARWVEILTGPKDASACFLAEAQGGRALGFIACGPAADGDVAPPPGAGEVYAVYLREEAKGRGVGAALMATAEEAMRRHGFERAVLWVLEDNVRARAFYERGGWDRDGAKGEHRFDCGHRPIIRYARDL